VSDEELRELYARCRFFVLPGEEDFGITPVEALASGSRGGARARRRAGDVPFFGAFSTACRKRRRSRKPSESWKRWKSRSGHRLAGMARQFSEEEFMRRMSAVLKADAVRTPEDNFTCLP